MSWCIDDMSLKYAECRTQNLAMYRGNLQDDIILLCLTDKMQTRPQKSEMTLFQAANQRQT